MPVTVATATKGSIGVYLDAIGTVTPVYTDSITAQVTGVITAVHYREGQTVHKGDPLIDIDSRPYEAQLAQAQGTLERDQNLLAEAQMDLKRYQDAWAKNAIPRQTLEDQEKVVLQDQGTVKNDEGTVQYDQVQVGYCHITSPIDGRVGLAPGRSRQPGDGQLHDSAGGRRADAAHHRDLHPGRRQSARRFWSRCAAARRSKWRPIDRTQQKLLAKGKLITVDNQIDTVTGTVKLRAQFDNCERHALPQPVRQHATAGEDTREPDSDSLLGDPAQRRHGFCLSHPGQQSGDEDREVRHLRPRQHRGDRASNPETWWPTAASRS